MPSSVNGSLRHVSPTATRKPFPLLPLVPPSLRPVVLDFTWDREKLWAQQLPAEEVALDELRWHLVLPMWSFENDPFVLSPEQVRADPVLYHDQYARTMAADLAFALHALIRPGGTLTLLDGVHRLLKADICGQQTVSVKKLPMDRLDDIAST
jgi:hypothetical protein